ncbi:MAG: quinolinate synthase NadA [Nitrososphaeria archaeon]
MIVEEIEQLKKELNALIMAHNYQLPEVQDVADFVGDSLELATKSKSTDADYIVLAGVDFMAETAAILNPGKTVLIPSHLASCEMARYLDPKTIEEYKKAYPESKIVLYINSTAECKALADSICTSANAAKVVKAIESDIVLFGPDANLAKYVSKNTKKKVIPLPPNGHCYVHTYFDPEEVLKIKRKDGGEVMAHPECVEEVQAVADVVASTGGMIKHVATSNSKKFIVVTECDMSYRLKKLYPDREFIPAWDNAICLGMRQITLEKIWESLKYKRYKVQVDNKIAQKARMAVERMFELT